MRLISLSLALLCVHTQLLLRSIASLCFVVAPSHMELLLRSSSTSALLKVRHISPQLTLDYAAPHHQDSESSMYSCQNCEWLWWIQILGRWQCGRQISVVINDWEVEHGCFELLSTGGLFKSLCGGWSIKTQWWLHTFYESLVPHDMLIKID